MGITEGLRAIRGPPPVGLPLRQKAKGVVVTGGGSTSLDAEAAPAPAQCGGVAAGPFHVGLHLGN